MEPISQGLLGTRDRSVKVAFSWNTPSPLHITEQREYEVLVGATVVITTPFNGATPGLSLGSPTEPGLIFSSSELKPKREVQFHSAGVLEEGTLTPLQLTIEPDGSSAGAGFVLLSFTGV